MVYAGKTQNRVMDSFIGHRSDLRGNDGSKPACHFRREGHEEEDTEMVVFEEVRGKDDLYLITRERF